MLLSSLPGIGSSPTGGEGCPALEFLPAGDQLPRIRQVEVGEEGDATIGARASVWGTTERRQEERGSPSSFLAPKTNGCAIDVPS